jgi:formylmethanofuran dehydrogenase subunit A
VLFILQAETERINTSKNLWRKKTYVQWSLSEIESYNVKFVVVGGGNGYTIEARVSKISLNDKFK